jgi:RNA-directed DNA polymerase
VFHVDSYGYRPGRSAHDALAVARQRCWRHDWVIDLDIRSFFDEIDRELLMRAVRSAASAPWYGDELRGPAGAQSQSET